MIGKLTVHYRNKFLYYVRLSQGNIYKPTKVSKKLNIF